MMFFCGDQLRQYGLEPCPSKAASIMRDWWHDWPELFMCACVHTCSLSGRRHRFPGSDSLNEAVMNKIICFWIDFVVKHSFIFDSCKWWHVHTVMLQFFSTPLTFWQSISFPKQLLASDLSSTIYEPFGFHISVQRSSSMSFVSNLLWHLQLRQIFTSSLNTVCAGLLNLPWVIHNTQGSGLPKHVSDWVTWWVQWLPIYVWCTWVAAWFQLSFFSRLLKYPVVVALTEIFLKCISCYRVTCWSPDDGDFLANFLFLKLTDATDGLRRLSCSCEHL
jgi:hypothetical protein